MKQIMKYSLVALTAFVFGYNFGLWYWNVDSLWEANAHKKEVIRAMQNQIIKTEELLDSIESDCAWLDVTGERDIYIEYINSVDNTDSIINLEK